MKRIIVILSFLTTAVLIGCLKDDPPIDFGNLQPLLEIPEGGLLTNNFDEGYLRFTGDTLTYTFSINLASPNVLTEDLTVELAVNPAKVSEYNALGGGITFQNYPDGTFILETSTVTIPAGGRNADVTIKFLDTIEAVLPDVSYMLPLSIVNAEGLSISENFGTKYFYTLGVCVAGFYEPIGKRVNYRGNAADSVFDSETILDGTGDKFMNVLAVDNVVDNISADTVQVPYADLGVNGWNYVIVFNCEADSIVSITPNETMRRGILLNSFVIYQQSYDPVLKQFFIKTGYKNSSRNERVTSEFLTLR